MFKKIAFALLLIFIAAVFYFQNDQRVHSYVGNHVKKIFEEVGNCSVSFKVKSVNLFIPSVTLQEVSVNPKGQDSSNLALNSWIYQAKSLRASCTWFSVLAYGIIDLYLDLRGVHGQSLIENGNISLLAHHIQPMIEAPSSHYPLFLKSILFKDAHMDLNYRGQNIKIRYDFDSESKKIENIFKTNIHLNNGYVTFDHRPYVDNIVGSISFDTSYNNNGIQFDLKTDCSVNLVQLPQDKRKSFITGSWHNTTGVFSIKGVDQSVDFKTITIECDKKGVHVDAHASLPLSYILHLINAEFEHTDAQGQCAIELKGIFEQDTYKVQGLCKIPQLFYGATKLTNTVQITCAKENDNFNGDISIELGDVGKMSGIWLFDPIANRGQCQLSNESLITVPSLPLWHIAAHAIKGNFNVDESRVIKGTYHMQAHNTALNCGVSAQGACSFDGDLCAWIGKLNQSTYECAFRVKPTFQLDKLLYADEKGKALVDLNAHTLDHKEFQGTITFDLLQGIIKHFFDYNLQGNGAFNIQGSLFNGIATLKIKLSDGSIIRLPQTYNVIHDVGARVQWEFNQKKLTAQDIYCQLYRGSIKSEKGELLLSDAYTINSFEFPIFFDSCLLNIKKDLFAMFSGNLNFSKEIDKIPAIKGKIIIDRSQLKENLFSDKLQKMLFDFAGQMFQPQQHTDIACDVSIETKEAIKVDTAFFQAQAMAHLHLANTVYDPKLSGSIQLLSGLLAFPYKPLHITKGHIYFLPDQMYDPIIELVASNKIKKYEVSLHVSGSLNNHHVALKSTPPLTDEQTVALLLAGSPEQSLNIVMPALLMQNLKTLLFESDQSPLRLNSFFKSWLKPLRMINLVPTFNDQAGRGGLRGSLEIEINDRWRALAEKNFSLSEDTRFEVEYAASDDITIRGIRNERRDVGTEVEMRWKFGS